MFSCHEHVRFNSKTQTLLATELMHTVREHIHGTLHVKEDMTGTGYCEANRYTQDMHRLDHMLWGHMNSTAHTRASEKGMKKQVIFPMIYASQSFWPPRQPHHLTLLPATQSRFLSPPAPLTSSCHYISLKFLWWEMSHLFLPTQAWASYRHVIPFGQCSGGRAPPSGFSSYYHHTSLEEKWGRDERNEVLCGAKNGAGNKT